MMVYIHYLREPWFNVWLDVDLPERIGMDPPEWTDRRNIGPEPIEDRRFLDAVPRLLRIPISAFEHEAAY